MLCPESRLELFKKLVIVEVGFDLRCDNTFYNFGQKGKVGDGSEVAQDVRVESGFFDDGGYSSQFE